MTILDDYIEKKRILIVGTGVGERSKNKGYYYANLNSNCMWSVLKKIGWINEIPTSKDSFLSLVKNSIFGFTDLVKDYSGNDNKVLKKYYRLSKDKIKVDKSFLENPKLLKIDIDTLLEKFRNRDYVIINGKPLFKILFDSDKYNYGCVNSELVKEKIKVENSKIIFLRNTVVRNENEREKIENKIFQILKSNCPILN